jgi:hypothetical protein
MLADLRRILESGSARRRSPGADLWIVDAGPWWRLFRDRGRLDRTEIDILSAVWRLPTPLYLFPGEEILDPELAPFVRAEGSAWRIETGSSPSGFRATEIGSTLGNWVIYSAEQPLPETAAVPDIFRDPPDRVIAFMAEHKVFVLIGAFYDATPWCVALCEPAR